jgi:hypothetical protein
MTTRSRSTSEPARSVSTVRDWRSIQALARLLDRESIPYALIGGHAVNTLLEPLLARDIDVTVVADAEGINRLRASLEGFSLDREFGAQLPSGPDFLRFVSIGRLGWILAAPEK